MLKVALVIVLWITASSFAQAQASKGITKVNLIAWPEDCKQLDVTKLEIGQVGRIAHAESIIMSVVNNSTLKILATQETHSSYDLVSLLIEDCPPTNDLVDDQKIVILDFCKVAEIKEHGGTRLFVLKMLSKEESTKLVSQQIEANKKTAAQRAEHKAKMQEQAERDFRTWTAKNGNKVVGKFVDYRSPNVQLELQTGKKIKVRIANLIDADASLAKKLDSLKKP